MALLLPFKTNNQVTIRMDSAHNPFSIIWTMYTLPYPKRIGEPIGIADLPILRVENICDHLNLLYSVALAVYAFTI